MAKEPKKVQHFCVLAAAGLAAAVAMLVLLRLALVLEVVGKVAIVVMLVLMPIPSCTQVASRSIISSVARP